jgi:hypothetical protein
VAVWLFAIAAAWGGECRWAEVESVEATTAQVTINGEAIPVRGPAHWLALQADLQRCGWFAAAKHLERWRHARQGVNVCVLLTAPTFLVSLWLGAPIFAITAGERHDAMISALQNEQ